MYEVSPLKLSDTVCRGLIDCINDCCYIINILYLILIKKKNEQFFAVA